MIDREVAGVGNKVFPVGWPVQVICFVDHAGVGNRTDGEERHFLKAPALRSSPSCVIDIVYHNNTRFGVKMLIPQPMAGR
jgi:hypothetical protein